MRLIPLRWRLGALLLALLLSGCKVDLYSELSEREANEMLAVLLRNNIASEKVPGGDGTVTIQVDEQRVADAIELLKSHGMPREDFDSIGQVFPREGLISSPLEERVRFIYALSQDVSATLSEIEGVIIARVHVVLPENNPFEERVTPSSASVFIKHREDINLEAFVPQIKLIVTNSIEGLAYDKVSVALFPTRVRSVEASPDTDWRQIGPLRLSRDSLTAFWALAGALLGLLLLALAGNALLWRRLRRPAQPAADG